MNEPRETYQRKIIKYLAKELSPAESNELLAWVKELPENQKLFDQLQTTWNKAGNVEDMFSPNVDAAWNKVKHKIGQGQSLKVPKETTMIKLSSESFWKIAASVVLVTSLSIVAFFYLNSSKRVELVTTDSKKEFLLPDSSKVWLSPHTMLSFQDGFAGDVREVKLDGEAFFEVKRNENKPFVVLGQKTQVKVLGTSFVVHTRADEKEEFVVVASGRVQFSERKDSHNQVVLTAGDQAIFDSKKTIELKAKSTQNAGAWKNNRLSFDNTPICDVINDLQLYFDATIQVDNNGLLDCKFTGDFEAPTLESVLKVLTVSLNSSYQKQDGKYVLRGPGCP